MAELTAAEKAEFRRQKILARKKARMAFVVEGDRSQLANSTNPTNASQENNLTETPTTITVTATTKTPTETQSETLSEPLQTDENIDPGPTSTSKDPELQTFLRNTSMTQTTIPDPFALPPSSIFTNPPVAASTPPQLNRQFIQIGQVPRILLIIITAIILCIPDVLLHVPISAVESFVLLRVLIDGVPLLLSVSNLIRHIRYFRLNLLELAASIPQIYSFTQSLWREFALYLTITFTLTSLLELNSVRI